jgi:hypothetical protein
MKLIQNQLFKGTREFEIVDDSVFVCIKSPFKQEKLTVDISTLNPEPVVNGSELEFHSRAKSESLFSLLLYRANTLIQRVLEEGGAFAGVEAVSHESSRPEAPGWNVYEEPPEFDKPDGTRQEYEVPSINVGRVDEDIAMLRTYLNEEDIKPLLNALEALKSEPQNEAIFQQMVDAYNKLGFHQGAVLTYAPYLKALLSRTIWS